ncbi:MAG: hypothetical protein AAB153_06195, partial [Pseudomonadota bacterium]
RRVLLRRLNPCPVTRAVRRSPFPKGQVRYQAGDATPWSLGAKKPDLLVFDAKTQRIFVFIFPGFSLRLRVFASSNHN